MEDLVHLFHEIGMLDATPRSGYFFLGSGKQSVAAHSFRMTLIAYTIAKAIEAKIDDKKLLLMCLYHDLPEARTGDLNYVNKKYVQDNLEQVLDDLSAKYQIGKEIVQLIEEYNAKATMESKIAHDADQLEMMLVLKCELEKGNQLALDWFSNAQKRIILPISNKIADKILTLPSYAWWLEKLS